MNAKFGLMAGAAIACAVMAGCKAPKAHTPGGTAPTMEPTRPARQTEIVTVDERPSSRPVQPVKQPEARRCRCVPGTVHDAPCACGAADCRCKVKEPAPEQEYTVYRVKGGDMLSSICKRYGLKQKKVLELNPGLDPNRLIAGRKIKLPGKIDLGGEDAAAKPAAGGAAAKPAAGSAAKPASGAGAKGAAAKSSSRVSSYSGPTKQYVVKNGDFLGKIALENGVTVKCLKDMNGLKTNNIRIGQKLKVPAEKPVAAAKTETASAAKPAEAPAKKDAAAAPAQELTAPAVPDAAAEPEKKAEAESAVEQVKATTEALDATAPRTHTVKDGEDVVSIAIQYGVSPSALMDLNDLKQNEELQSGRVLKLPANAKMP